MRRLFFHILICACPLLWQSAASAEEYSRTGRTPAPTVDPGIRDTLRIDPFAAGLGSQIVVPVNFFNDENLGGLEVVLAYDVATLVCDSVSFASTTAPGSQVSRIDTLNGTIIAAIFLLDAPSIPPQTGLFAELYLSPVGAPQPMMIFIDTTSIILDTITTRRTLFSSSNPAASIFPEYAGGVGEALPYVAGDANSDGKVNIADVTYLISWLFSAGPDPPNRAAADPNASCNVNIADVTFLISRIFAFGPAPKAGCAT